MPEARKALFLVTAIGVDLSDLGESPEGRWNLNVITSRLQRFITPYSNKDIDLWRRGVVTLTAVAIAHFTAFRSLLTPVDGKLSTGGLAVY